MKKSLMIVLFVLILVPTVLAGEEEIFSDIVYPENDTMVDGKLLDVAISGSEVSVSYGSAWFFFNQVDCQTEGFIKVCLIEKNNFFVDLSLSVITTDLEINKTPEDDVTSFLVNDRFNVTLTARNTGNRKINYLKLEEKIEDFEIIGASGCEIKENKTIFLETSLNPGSRFECTYRLKAIKPGSFNLKTNIDFNNGYENESKTSQKIIEVIEYAIDQAYSTDKSSYLLGEKAKITFTINSSYPYDININKLLLEPTGIVVLESTLKHRKAPIEWSGQIEANSSMEYTITVQLINITNSLTTKLDFSTILGTVIQLHSAIVPTESTPPMITLKSVTSESIIINITNTNTALIFNRINLETKSALNKLKNTTSINLLTPGNTAEIVINTGIDTNKTILIPIFFSGKFYTENNELRTFSSTSYINITGQGVIEIVETPVINETEIVNPIDAVQNENITIVEQKSEEQDPEEIENQKKNKELVNRIRLLSQRRISWSVFYFIIGLVILVIAFIFSIKYIKTR